MKKVLKKGSIISITGRRWFDRSAGNTYHSVLVVVNGQVIGVENFKYGYDEGYLQTAWALIWEKFKPCKGLKPTFLPWWQLKEFYRINQTVSDVSRKKDLTFS